MDIMTLLMAKKFGGGSGSGGASHWNELEGKPFVTVGGDTLTWDGNTEGLDVFNGVFYKVTDIVITANDVASGVKMYTMGAEADSCTVDSPMDGALSIQGTFGNSTLFVFSFTEAAAAEAGAPSGGTYFTASDDWYVYQLTIPGYTGFAKEQIDPAVLPESVATKDYVNEMLGVIENGTY